MQEAQKLFHCGWQDLFFSETNSREPIARNKVSMTMHYTHFDSREFTGVLFENLYKYLFPPVKRCRLFFFQRKKNC
jgi:hypothetical protein